MAPAGPGLLSALVFALSVGGVAGKAPIVRHASKELAAEERSAPSVVLLQSGFERHPQVLDGEEEEEAEYKQAFASFISTYSRTYKHGTAEFLQRFGHFRRAAAAVDAQNSRPGRLWDAAINELSDWSPDELKQLRGWRGGVVRDEGPEPAVLGQGSAIRKHKVSLPSEFKNWTKLQAAKHIENQGGCGSCWAVTSATVLKAHSEIYGSARSFSAQELVNCVDNPLSCGGTGGCQGATAELAFNYVATFGLHTADSVPYRGSDGTCHNSKAAKTARVMAQGVGHSLETQMAHLAKPGVHQLKLASLSSSVGMQAWERLPENKYEPLKRALVEYGPVAVSVAAEGWNGYSSGVYDGCQQDAIIDHAVTLIGYGTSSSNNKKFWIVQNSWGKQWGESGHIRILREDRDDYHCGTDTRPKDGTGCKGGPATVRVCGMCGIHYDSVVPHFK